MKRNAKRLLALGLSALMTAGILAGCGGGTTAGSSYPVTVAGVTVTQQPEGVVVLSDSLADIVLSLGYEGQLKGKSADCDQTALSILQDYTPDDAEAIRATGADTVLLDTEPTAQQRAALEAAGLQVLVIPMATDRESLTTLYCELGSLLQGSDGFARGEKSANSLLMTLDDIDRSIPEKKAEPTACYLYDLSGTVVTGDSLAGKLFAYAGLINIFDSEIGGTIGNASITAGNPRYIFCAPGLKDEILSSKQYQKLGAVQKGRVYELDPTLLERQGSSILQAVVAMAGTAYPELLSDARTDKNDSAILEA